MWDIILFDLDGTLTDSKDGIINSVLNALNHFGIQAERDHLLPFVGPPLHESFRDYYGFGPEQIRTGTEKFREYFSEKGWLENALYPGIEDFLKELKAAGKTLAVATSKPEQFAKRILEHFGLAQYFDHICGAPMNEQQGARKAKVIKNVLSYYGYAADAVMVGDRKHDVAGAHEAGLPVIGVLYGYGDRVELENAGAEYVVEDLEELKKLLLRDNEIAERWVQAFDQKRELKDNWQFFELFMETASVACLEGRAAQEAFDALDYDTAITFRNGRMVNGRPRISNLGTTAKISAAWAAQEADTGCEVYITDKDFRWTYVENHEHGWFGPYFCKLDGEED